MKRGRVQPEHTKLRDEIPDNGVVRSHAAERIARHRRDGVKPRSEPISAHGTDGDALSYPPTSEGTMSVICWKRVPRPGKLRKKWSSLLSFRLPDLKRWSVRISGRERQEPCPAVPVALPLPAPTSPRPEAVRSVSSQAPDAKLAGEIRTKAAPAAPKRSVKAPKADVTPMVSAPPKPLKVIRRRGEQAPKIFETPPKTVPLAMLEGISYRPDEDAES